MLVLSCISNNYKEKLKLNAPLLFADDEIMEVDASGKWWVKDSVYYEQNTEMSITDSYHYKFIDKDNIEFQMIKSDSPLETIGYTFIDTRVE